MVEFELVVVGAGVGGYSAAIRGAQLGLKTAIVERRPVLGGTCLNEGCIPSKAMLESSEFFHMARHEAATHGVRLGEVALDLDAMLARKRGVVERLTDGVRALMKKNRITVFEGTAELAAPGEVKVTLTEGGEETLAAKHIVLATGSVPAELPHIPFDGEHVVSSTEALAFTQVPEHLVVVGAGAVGLELGSVWARLGAQVTVVEVLPRILPFADKQMASALQRALKGQGLELRLKTRVEGATVEDQRHLGRAQRREGQTPRRCAATSSSWRSAAAPTPKGWALRAWACRSTSGAACRSTSASPPRTAGIYAVGRPGRRCHAGPRGRGGRDRRGRGDRRAPRRPRPRDHAERGLYGPRAGLRGPLRGGVQGAEDERRRWAASCSAPTDAR